VNVVLSDFAGSASAGDALGAGYYVSFANDAPYACRGSDASCTVASAQDSIVVPTIVER
jgi:hypothetical protein